MTSSCPTGPDEFKTKVVGALRRLARHLAYAAESTGTDSATDGLRLIASRPARAAGEPSSLVA